MKKNLCMIHESILYYNESSRFTIFKKRLSINVRCSLNFDAGGINFKLTREGAALGEGGGREDDGSVGRGSLWLNDDSNGVQHGGFQIQPG